MALFRRKKESVLPEVDQYYEAERRDRTGVAWLLALVSVAVVAAIIVGLFLGGRWAYNKIANNDSGDETAQIADNEDTPSFDNGDEPEAPADEEEEEEPETPARNDSESEDESEGTVNAPARTETPSTGDSEELPNTGPADTALVFALVSTVAGAAHYAVQRRKV